MNQLMSIRINVQVLQAINPEFEGRLLHEAAIRFLAPKAPDDGGGPKKRNLPPRYATHQQNNISRESTISLPRSNGNLFFADTHMVLINFPILTFYILY